MLVEPGLEGRRGFAGGVLAAGRQVVAAAVPGNTKQISFSNFCCNWLQLLQLRIYEMSFSIRNLYKEIIGNHV